MLYRCGSFRRKNFAATSFTPGFANPAGQFLLVGINIFRRIGALDSLDIRFHRLAQLGVFLHVFRKSRKPLGIFALLLTGNNGLRG